MTDEKPLTMRQLANWYEVSKSTIQRWRREGRLPTPAIRGPRPLWFRADLKKAKDPREGW